MVADAVAHFAETLKCLLAWRLYCTLQRTLSLSPDDAGAYALASVSGLADVDAITLSMCRLAGNGLVMDVAAIAIALAAGVNTGAKAVLGWVTGGVEIGRPLATGAGISIATGFTGFVLKSAF